MFEPKPLSVRDIRSSIPVMDPRPLWETAAELHRKVLALPPERPFRYTSCRGSLPDGFEGMEEREKRLEREWEDKKSSRKAREAREFFERGVEELHRFATRIGKIGTRSEDD